MTLFKSTSSAVTDKYTSLRAIDWTFAGAATRGETHGIHPYPAKFIPQIPRQLIQALHPGDNSAVLDPFCGSGTTLVEASRAGVPSIGIDLHPLACLLSKVKVTPLSTDLETLACEIANRATLYTGPIPDIPAIDHWFRPEIQRVLAGLVNAIHDVNDADAKDALRIALSSIVVRVSNQESDTRYAAISKPVSADQVIDLFHRSCQSIARAIDKTWRNGTPRGRVQVIHKDTLLVAPTEISEQVSLVVTSPPYPNAYEYWLYHKYRMYWLGMDPLAVRASEIGARPHYFKAKPQTAADFERQMGKVFEFLSRIMTAQGHACFQVGSSVIRGETIDNAAIIRRCASTHGFELALALRRQIPANKKAFNLSHARANTEDLIVLRLNK